MEIKDVKHIVSGWEAILKGDTTEVHKERANVCSTCEHKKLSIVHKLLPDVSGTKEVNGMVCNDCDSVIKCPLQAKIRTEEKICDKWER